MGPEYNCSPLDDESSPIVNKIHCFATQLREDSSRLLSFDHRPYASDGPIYLPLKFLSCEKWIAALADSGSFASLMSETVAQKLNFQLSPTTTEVQGINSMTKPIGEVKLDFWIGMAYFPNMSWLVMPAQSMPIPLIVGRQLHQRCTRIFWNFPLKTVHFVAEWKSVHVPFINDPRREPFVWPEKPQDVFVTLDRSKLTNYNPDTLISYLHERYGVNLNAKHEPAEELRKVMEILIKREHVFACDERPLGKFNAFEARLNTIPGKTAYVPQYRVPEKYEKPIQKELDKMLANGVIEECKQNRSWNTPIGAVEKCDGSIRLICNYKVTLNKILCEEDNFQIPSLEEETINIGPGNRYFCTMDVKQGYFNIGLDKQDRCKTSFFWYIPF